MSSDSQIEEIQCAATFRLRYFRLTYSTAPAVAEETKSREIPIIIEQNSSQSSGYSVSSVAAVILAGSFTLPASHTPGYSAFNPFHRFYSAPDPHFRRIHRPKGMG